jgi:hypothetical protein
LTAGELPRPAGQRHRCRAPTRCQPPAPAWRPPRVRRSAAGTRCCPSPTCGDTARSLEDHGDLAVARCGRWRVRRRAAPTRTSGTRAGDHSENRGLATPRRPEKHHEFAVGNVQAHIVDGHGAVFEDLRYVSERDSRHAGLLVPLCRSPHPRRQSPNCDGRHWRRLSGKRRIYRIFCPC